MLTERTDRYLIDDEWIEYQVMGTFEVDGRIISAWRDYFDLTQSGDQSFDYPRPERTVPIQ